VIALDGASLGFIVQRVAIGQMPNFGRLLDRGGVIDLATVRPTQTEPVWAAAATGKASQKNGVRSGGAYRVSDKDQAVVDILPGYCFSHLLVDEGFVEAFPRTAAALRARPIWDILTDYGITTGVTSWPLTYPAHARAGFIVSDHFDEAQTFP